MKQPQTFKQAQTTLQFLLGPIKIKDGLFMGDQLAAKVVLSPHRISNSSLATKLHTSSIQSPKQSLIFTNDSVYNIFLCTGLRRRKTYKCF